MASSLQVVFLLSLTCGLFIAGAMSRAEEHEEVPACPPGCLPGWTQFGHRCFNFFRKARTWADAEMACIAIGGNLASIHSAEENQFLSELIEQVAGHRGLLTWIGGFDAVEDKKWFWSVGKMFNYQAWGNGQPDNRAGENCAEMNFAGTFWADSKCSHSKPYVCARDVQVTPH